MKKSITFLFVCLLLTITSKAQVWEPVGNSSGISSGGVGRLTLVNDSQDNLVVGYYDGSAGKGSVQRFDGTAWSYLGGQPGMTSSYATYNSLCVDDGGVVYFTNQASWPASGLKVRKFATDAWEDLPDATSTNVQFQSSAISADGTLFTASGDNGGTVRKYVDGAWQQVGNAGFMGSYASYVDMAITSSGVIYVSWNNGGYVHVFANTVGASTSDLWEGAGNEPNIAPGTSSENYNSCLAVDNNNNLFLAYVSNGDGGRKLNVKKFDGSAWSQVGPENFTEGRVQHISIAVDENSNVYVAASNWEDDNFLKNYVMAYDDANNTWYQAGTGWASEGQATYNSLAVDNNGNIFLAFYDSGLGKLSVKKLYLAPETKYPSGWCGISSNVMPESKVSMEEIFAPVLDDMVILVGQTGIFWPGQNVNTIGDWDTYQGYKVKFSKGVDFDFEGAELLDKTITLEPGFAYIPVLSMEPIAVENVLVPHENDIEFVFDLVSQEVYWPAGGIVPGVEGALTTLEPGYAYLIQVNNTVTLDFGNEPVKSGTTPAIQTNFVNNTNWNNITRTGVQHIISVTTGSLESGDVVGAFNSEGNCVGMVQYNGIDQMIPLVVYGDDVTTSGKDGMTQNELMSLRIFRNGNEIEASPVYCQDMENHDGLFAENGLSIIRDFIMGTTDINNGENTAFSIFPNPSNGRFDLRLGNGNNCDISIMNLNGQTVYSSQINGSTMINLSDQPKGVYFVRLSDSNSTSIEKIVIE